MSKYLKHHLKLGNRLFQTCEFSQKLGASILTIWVYRTAGGCSRLRENKIKHPIHRLLRQNHNIIIFRTKIEMKKESVFKCCKILELGWIVLSGDVVFAKIVLVDDLFTAWALTENIFPAIRYTKAWIWIYFQIVCLFFTTMLYKLLKKDKGLYPRKCFINILKLYYTAEQI